MIWLAVPLSLLFLLGSQALLGVVQPAGDPVFLGAFLTSGFTWLCLFFTRWFASAQFLGPPVPFPTVDSEFFLAFRGLTSGAVVLPATFGLLLGSESKLWLGLLLAARLLGCSSSWGFLLFLSGLGLLAFAPSGGDLETIAE